MNRKRKSLIRCRGDFLKNGWGYEFADRREFWDRGPSKFFYNELTKMHEEKYIDELLDDRYFFVCMYGALASWGLDRMGKGGPKMRDFEDFRQEITKAREEIISLSDLEIPRDAKEAEKGLLHLFGFLDVPQNANGTKIVANSKTMHFLLPKISPIIDREYIMRYFLSKNLKAYPNLNVKDEEEFFIEVADAYYSTMFEYCMQGREGLKFIDNAIVNYVRRKMERVE